MNDREFLMWIHERLELVYGEDRYVDYMHRLRDIIENTPRRKHSKSRGVSNSLAELRQFLATSDKQNEVSEIYKAFSLL